jgi:hypothetical protein
MKLYDWKPAQDAELLDMAARRVPVDERARHFGVSTRAVQARLTELKKRVVARSGNASAPSSANAVRIPEREKRDTQPAPPPDDDIPIDTEDFDPPDRVEIVEPAPGASAAGSESTRSKEWSVDGASRERLLAKQLAEVKSRYEKLLDELHQRDEQLHIARALADATVAPIVGKPRTPGHRRHGVPVLMCSDWHIEELVRSETVNGLNEYNLEIADRCIDCMTDAFEWMLKDSRYDCREGVVWLGGDLISGYIHEELAEQNQLSPVESVLWLFQRCVRMLTRILAETALERIIVVCNDGNHGRLTHKMRVSTRTENSLEWLLYQQLAAHFANESRLQFQIADGVSNYLKVYDTTICFQHGDTFRYGGGVGGLLIPVRRGANELRKYQHFDHLVIGHFHQRSDMGDIVVNGSMIGISPYGMSIKATPEPRQQSWFLVDQERGKCLSAPIWLPQTAS